jgi:uncharacterized caspase-like protein
MLRLLFFVYLCVMSLTSVASDQKMQRFALVIGNTSYVNAPLKNSGNDAKDIADSLTDLGFRVSLLADSELAELTNGVRQFYSEVKRHQYKKKLAIIYYAGHAIQVNHQNYIVPLGLAFENQQQFISGLYEIGNFFTEISNTKNLQNIIILDACRNNPFENGLLAINGIISSGLAPIKAPSNTLIAFATEPGGVASDGSGKNGVYTKHLLRHIDKQIRVEEVFKKVRTGVAKETRNKQIPWEHSSLLSDVFFSPPKNRDIPDLIVF